MIIGQVAKQLKKTKHRDNWLSRLILQGMFIYLRFKEGCFEFNVDDPVPAGDKKYDPKLEDVFIIFDATTDDPHFVVKGKLDVVTDGNMPLARRLHANEKTGLKRLAGRPKKKQASSRCKAVAVSEAIKLSRKSIGGLFGTMNMKKKHKDGGNEIVQLAEMKNGECTEYKEKCIKRLVKQHVTDGNRKRKLKIGTYAHDCACVVKGIFEGVYCDECVLDNYHRKKHKCGLKGTTKKSLNSLAAEQLWSRLHPSAATISHFDRPHYRCFLRHYCKWRNDYVRSTFVQDTHSLISRRRAHKRVRQR